MTLQSHKDDEKHSQDLLCYLFYFRLLRQPHDTIRKTTLKSKSYKGKTTEYVRIVPVQQQSRKDADRIMSSDKRRNLSSTKTVLQPTVLGPGGGLVLGQATSGQHTSSGCSKEEARALPGNALGQIPLPSKALQNAQTLQAHVQNKAEEGGNVPPSVPGSHHSPWHPCRAVTFRAAGPIAPQFKQRATKKVQYSITSVYSIGLGLLIFTRQAHKSIYQLIKVCFLTSKTDGIGQKRLACQTANHGCPLHKITHLS